MGKYYANSAPKSPLTAWKRKVKINASRLQITPQSVNIIVFFKNLSRMCLTQCTISYRETDTQSYVIRVIRLAISSGIFSPTKLTFISNVYIDEHHFVIMKSQIIASIFSKANTLFFAVTVFDGTIEIYTAPVPDNKIISFVQINEITNCHHQHDHPMEGCAHGLSE